MRLFIPFGICFLLIFGCASHPVINPHLPEAGKVKKGYALSVENVVPYMWYRKGINEKSDIIILWYQYYNRYQKQSIYQ